ncbi:MAG: hypothetical protein M3R35_04135 [Candidatus Eremiobacteraeota bacterium]|nr:hypothetical protein [Candidatus Eremiobacteraeota bacterium]
MNAYVSAALLGAGSGMRASVAPFASRWKRTGRFPLRNALALAGELAADKMPFAGPRTALPALVARAGAAGIATRCLPAGSRLTRVGLAGTAAASAVACAFAMMRARKELVERSGLADAAVAVVEDALALAVVIAATRANGKA